MKSIDFKKVGVCLIYFIVSVMVYLYLCMIFAPKNISDIGGKSYYAGKGFLAEPVSNSVDVIVFGNSDVYSGVSPIEIYKKHGYTSFSSGAAWQTIGNINKLLDRAIEKQKPKVAVLEVDCLYTKSGKSISDAVFFGSPFIYHSRWKEIGARDFYTIPSKSDKYDYNKGYIYNKKVTKVKKRVYMGKRNSNPKKMSMQNYKDLMRFIKTCKDNDIKVFFLELPSANSWNYGKHNHIKEIAKEQSIEFLDMNVPESNYTIDFDRDFKDQGNHLNIHGAIRASEYLGDYLKANYSDVIKDRRQDEKLQYWKKAQQKYCNKHSDEESNKHYNRRIDINPHSHN